HRHAMEIANARDVAAPDVGGQMSDVGSAASGLTSDVGNQTSGEPEGLDLFQQLIAALTASRRRNVEFVRDPGTGRIAGARIVEAGNDQPRRPLPAGARQARDGRYYLPDPDRPGKYLMVVGNA